MKGDWLTTKTAYIVFDGRRYIAYSTESFEPASREGASPERDKLEKRLTKRGYTHFEYFTAKAAGA